MSALTGHLICALDRTVHRSFVIEIGKDDTLTVMLPPVTSSSINQKILLALKGVTRIRNSSMHTICHYVQFVYIYDNCLFFIYSRNLIFA